jgi:hypothetical protein
MWRMIVKIKSRKVKAEYGLSHVLYESGRLRWNLLTLTKWNTYVQR